MSTPSTDINIQELLETSFLNYSMSVICSRALPNVVDGLKPVHRRILWAMKQLRLSPSGSPKKSARIVGEVIGKYHPHGDQSVYHAMVRMAQDWIMGQRLVIGQGNFGSIEGDPPAAMRYTEVKLSRTATFLLQDTDNKYVPFRDNFDGSEVEPEVLGAMFPNLIVNGSEGIAVGMATRMFPHNLHEVISAAIWHIDNIDTLYGITDEDVQVEQAVQGYMNFMKGPDFPTGGKIYGVEGIEQGFRTGQGTFRCRAKIDVKSGMKKHQLIITETPYGLNIPKMLITIGELVKSGEFSEISDARDISSDYIIIDLKKGADPDVVKNKLFTKAGLDQSYNYLNLVLVNGLPEIVSLYKMFNEWLLHRMGVVAKRLGHELADAKNDHEIKTGHVKAPKHIDVIVEIVLNSTTPLEIQKRIEALGFTEKQADHIARMSLNKLASFEVKKLEVEVEALQHRIDEIEAVLNDEKKLLEIIRTELMTVRTRQAAKRRSVVSTEFLGIKDLSELIKHEQVMVSLTRDNYVRRVALIDYKVQHRAGKGTKGVGKKDDDDIIETYVMTTHDMMLLFTNTGQVYKMQAWDIPPTDKKAKGIPLVNLLQLKPEELIIKILPIKEFDKHRDIIFATRQGKVKSTNLLLFKNIRPTGIRAINLEEGDDLLDVYLSHEFDEDHTIEKYIIMTSTMNKAVKFPLSEVKSMKRGTIGCRGIKLKDGSGQHHECLSMAVVSDDDELLVLTTDGWGKRTTTIEFPKKHRATMGTICKNKHTQRGGDLFGAFKIREDDEVLFISSKGRVIRIAAKEIRKMQRTGLGIRLMVMKANDSLVSLSIRKNNGLFGPEPEDDGESPEPEAEPEQILEI